MRMRQEIVGGWTNRLRCPWTVWGFSVLQILAQLSVEIVGYGFDGIPGDYCKIRAPIRCCASRDDDCTARILDTLCYCDMFCDRSDSNDCCPDFKQVCRGEKRPPPPTLPPIVSGSCLQDGIQYQAGAKIKRNCNKCICEQTTALSNSARWNCEEHACLIQEDLLPMVNSGSYGWKASNYSEFWGQTLDEGLLYRLGTLFPDRSVQSMNEILVTPNERIPEQFDARQKWPRYIHAVRNQENCGASWAFSTTSLSADRLAIMSEGKLLTNELLSPQQMLSCNQHRQKGCEGGFLDRAWYYIRKLGVVRDECYPYTSHANSTAKCLIPKTAYEQQGGIVCPSNFSDNRIFKITPPYRLSRKEAEIQTEIMTNGPVQATFLVHEDFYMYKNGVYKHTQLAAAKGPKYAKSDFHSIRILGWGVDYSAGSPVKYWLCDNSWGTGWGEQGLFKILRGENHCQIESFVIGVWGKGQNKRRLLFKTRKLRKFRRRL